MADDAVLDQVADRIAELPARMARFTVPTIDPRVPWPGRLVAGLRALALLPMFLRLLLQLWRLPDDDETRRLYRGATGADHDRACADLRAVNDRLFHLGSAPETQVRRTSQWLVRWVAAGRPAAGPHHDVVEACFAEVVEAPSARADPSTLLTLTETYAEAWRALLDDAPRAADGSTV